MVKERLTSYQNNGMEVRRSIEANLKADSSHVIINHIFGVPKFVQLLESISFMEGELL